jgi:uncharacterized protein (DUF488 family)
MAEPIYTIGHSTHPIDQFIALLGRSAIQVVVDVRTVPRSRTNPQFNRETLPASLAEAGIDYVHLPSLGGLRSRSRETPTAKNAFWQNASFHNYADYAMTEAFREGLGKLRQIAETRRTAIMCSEAVWWRCHRRIIADYLIHDGVPVFHIVSTQRVEAAKITPAAVAGTHHTLTYPAIS